MATHTKEVSLSSTKNTVFDTLKAAAPALFGTKIFTDVDFFAEDPDDNTKLLMTFKKEPDGGTRLKSERIRETKSVVYGLLAAAFPSAFGGRLFATVTYFNEDQLDNSKFKVVWAEDAI